MSKRKKLKLRVTLPVDAERELSVRLSIHCQGLMSDPVNKDEDTVLATDRHPTRGRRVVF